MQNLEVLEVVMDPLYKGNQHLANNCFIESSISYPLDLKINDLTMIVLDYCANKICAEAARPEVRKLWYDRFFDNLDKNNLKLIIDYPLNDEINTEHFCLEMANKIKSIARKQYNFDEFSPRSLAKFFNSSEDDLDIFLLIDKLKMHIYNHDLWILFKDILIFNPNLPSKIEIINFIDMTIDQKANFIRERIAKCNRAERDKCFSIFEQTIELSCNRKDLRTLPNEITFFSKLKVLNIHNTQLRKIPKVAFCKLLDLRKIYLYHNKLIEIPQEIGNLTKLKSLYFDYNNLEKIPLTIGNLKKLQILNLNSNYLKSLPLEICNLGNLIRLRIYNNRLEEIPESIGNLKKLVYLNCENNNIKKLPNSIEQLTLLEHLTINNNKLQTLPNGIAKLLKLEILHFNHNCIQEIPEGIGRLPRLNSIKINNNPIQRLPFSFHNFLNKNCLHDVTLEQLQKLLEEDNKEKGEGVSEDPLKKMSLLKI